MSEYSWPDDRLASGHEDPAAWTATCDALPIGTAITGTVTSRQRFGVFLQINGAPQAIGLAEITSIPRDAALPTLSAQVTGEVIGHGEHNHQVQIRLIQSTDDPRWSHIDPLILAGSNIQAIVLIREAFDCGIHPAVDLLDERYTLLQHVQPEDFSPPPAT